MTTFKEHARDTDDKSSLSERDICTEHFTPALVLSGWDLHRHIREEGTFTAGRIRVRGVR